MPRSSCNRPTRSCWRSRWEKRPSNSSAATTKSHEAAALALDGSAPSSLQPCGDSGADADAEDQGEDHEAVACEDVAPFGAHVTLGCRRACLQVDGQG